MSRAQSFILSLCALLLSGCTIQPLQHVQQELICKVELRKLTHGELSLQRGMQLERGFVGAWKADALCPTAHPEYRIDLDFDLVNQAALIQGDTTVARSNLVLRVNYRLYNESEELVFGEKLMLIDSYDHTESHYSNFITEEAVGMELVRNAARDLQISVLSRLMHDANQKRQDEATPDN